MKFYHLLINKYIYKIKTMSKKINITDKELDRDIVNLNLPEVDLISEKNLDFYDDEMKEWLNDDDNIEENNSAEE